jgi:peptidoglycan/LPS O-acetylase OafA/YrhL
VKGYLALAGASIVGTAAELASERHWDGAIQLIPWAALGLLALALGLLLARRTTRAIRVVRGAAVAAALCGVIGVYEHVLENHRAGPLDYRYTDRWPDMSAASTWWTAITKTTGPAPVLAPAILVLAAACLSLATVGLPGGRAPTRGRSPRA